jgi:short-subunit dehydrogenase
VRPVTLVTGASAGLGAEFARACAKRGDELVLVARRQDRLDALAREIGGAHVMPADLAAPGAAERLIEAIGASGLTVATLVNNAGFGLAGTFAALPLARQREMLALNVGALTELAHLVLPRCWSGARARSSTSHRPAPSRPAPASPSISRPRPMSSPSPKRSTRS